MTDPLIRLKTIKDSQRQMKMHYDFWLKEAVRQRYSNVKIASTLGMTEAAIRMYRKRNGI